ncbi:phosphatase PAP2 family protein [Aliivibrio salmonicida]|uniref:phosphatase PAP2 family protein n=1 Tax=Aliivibrio salmonicida TaxID=40269 RepID=UPI003D147B39
MTLNLMKQFTMLFSFSPKNRIYELVAFFLFIAAMLLVILIIPTPNLFDPMSETANGLLSLLSRSAGHPLFIVTSAILCCLPIIKRMPFKKILSLYLQFAILLVLSLILKTSVKAITEIPRPFTQALTQVSVVESPDAFYLLKEQDKQDMISMVETLVSPARIDQWRQGTNYSFPSGHTIFAAICVLFWGGFLLRHKHYVLTAAVISWGVGVGLSRLWLGMHWPTDLMASIISASILILCVPTINLEKEPIDKN